MSSFFLRADNEEDYKKIKKSAIEYVKKGNVERGINILKNAIPKLKDKEKKIKLIISDLYFHKANKLEKKKEYDQCIIYLKKSLTIRKVYDIDKASYTLFGIGSIYFTKQDFKNARKYFEEALDLNKTNNNISNYMWIYFKMGKMYAFLKDPKQMIFFYKKALIYSKKNNNIKLVILLYEAIAFNYQKQSKFNDSTKYYKELLQVCRKNKIQKNIGFYIYQIGQNYHFSYNFKEALKYYKISLNNAKKNKLGILITEIQIEKGRIYNAWGKKDYAIELFFKALKNAILYNYKHGQSLSFYYLGTTYRFMKKYNLSIEYYKKAMQIYLENGRKKAEIKVLNEIADIFNIIKEYKKAKENFKKALSLAERTNHNEGKIKSLIGLGKTNDKLTLNIEALKNFNLALKLLSKTDFHNLRTYALYEIGNHYNLMHNYSKAIEYLNKCIVSCQFTSQKFYLSSANSLLGNIYYSQDKFQIAINTYMNVIKINNKLNLKNSSLPLLRIAKSYKKLHKYSNSIKYLNKALIEAKKYKSIYFEISILNSFGEVYSETGDIDKAINIYNQALLVSKTNNLKDRLAEIYRLIGEVYEESEKYDLAIENYKKSINLYNLIKDMGNEALTNSFMGELYRDKLSDFKIALEYFLKSSEIYNKINSESLDVADGYNNIGQLYLYTGKSDNAIKYFNLALNIKKLILDSNHIEIGEIIGNIGMAYYFQKKNISSEKYLKQALKIFNENYITNDYVSKTYANLGTIYIERQEYNIALEFFNKARNISNNSAVIYNGLGHIFLNKGKFKIANKYFLKALSIQEKKTSILNIDTISIYNNLGLIFSWIGDYNRAIYFSKKALFLRKKTLGESHESTAKSYVDLGSLYIKIGIKENGITYLNKALSIILNNYNEKHPALLYIYMNLGFGYIDLKNYLLAKENIEKAIKIQRKTFGRIDKGTSGLLYYLGIIYLHLNDEKSALKYFKFFKEFEKEFNSPYEKNVFKISYDHGIGLLNFNKKNYKEAIKYFKSALYNSSKNNKDRIELKYYLSSALKQSERYKEAILEIKKGLFQQDKIRFTLLEDRFKQSFFSIYQNGYKLLFSLYNDINNPVKAFETAEISKSVVFTEKISKRKSREKIALKKPKLLALIDKENEILNKLDGSNELNLNNKVFKSSILTMNKVKDYDNLFNELLQLRKTIKTNYKKYYNYLYPAPINLKNIQKIIKNNETYISYYLMDEYTNVFLITKNSFESIKLNISRNSILEKIKILRKAIIKPPEIISILGSGARSLFYKHYSDYILKYPKISHEFYKVIFKPIYKKIKTNKIIISADGVLYGFPFEALTMDENNIGLKFDNKKYLSKIFNKKTPLFNELKSLKFLGNKYSIIYIPNAYALDLLRNRRKQNIKTNGVIAFADPLYQNKINQKSINNGKNDINIVEGELYIKTKAIQNWPPIRLSETAEEAEGFKNEIGSGNVFKREQASEKNVFNMDLSKAKYLLFSTHGVLGNEFNKRNITEPALILSLVNNGEEFDGIFGMSEASGLDLNTNIVILSACNSTGKNGKGGEGFAGMVRSFIYAGSKAVIATHWQIESSSTKDFIISLGKELKTNSGFSALKNTKKKIMNKIKKFGNIKVSLAHPYFWSSFVYIGD